MITFRLLVAIPKAKKKVRQQKMWHSKGHHPVRSRRRRSDGAEWGLYFQCRLTN